MKNKTNLLICLLALMGLPLMAQPLNRQVKQTMELVRHNNYSKGIYPFQKSSQTEAGTLLQACEPYLADSIGRVRAFAYELVHLAGKAANDKGVRQKAVQCLLVGCKDKEPGSAGIVGKYLQQYKRDDFSTTARDSIAALVRRADGFLDNIVLVAGYLNLQNTVPDLKALLTNRKYNDKTRWNVHLALSRMGDQAETRYCIGVVQSKTMSNAVVYHMVPGLIYTRQKAAYDYLVTLLNSNDKNCMSPNPDSGAPIVCGFRIMEFLAPVIRDFPLQTIAGTNQIRTNDYNAALETARKWFEEREGKYEMNDEWGAIHHL